MNIIIKNNAQVPLVFGTGYIFKLQELTAYFIGELTEVQYNALMDSISSKKDREPWMEHYITLWELLAAIEQSAIDNGFTVQGTQPEDQSLDTP